MEIRHAEQRDLEALTEIYNYYVRETAITFDIEPKTIAERQTWLNQFAREGRHQLFVADVNGQVLGYAGSMRFKEKQAYETSVETTVYLTADTVQRGVGSQLYARLFQALAEEDVHRAYAGITQPNEGSIALHVKFGFTYLGTYQEVGRKFGRFWDVQWFEKSLP